MTTTNSDPLIEMVFSVVTDVINAVVNPSADTTEQDRFDFLAGTMQAILDDDDIVKMSIETHIPSKIIWLETTSRTNGYHTSYLGFDLNDNQYYWVDFL